MFRYSQFIHEDATHAAIANAHEVATGELESVDELFALDFVRGATGTLMIQFHPQNRKLANLVVIQAKGTITLASLEGDIKPGRIITEYIGQPVRDVPAFVPPKDWGEPTPLDDLLASGVVKKV